MVKVSNAADKVAPTPYPLLPAVANDENHTIFPFTVLHATICYLHCSLARGVHHRPCHDRYWHQLNHTTAPVGTPYHVSTPLP